VIGFAGVLTLVWDQVASARGATGATATVLAAAAALGATLLYGIAANYTKRKLSGVDPLVNATGSMIGSTVLLVPFAIATWPAAAIGVHAWGAVLALGIACTGVAYFIFFYLIAHVGPARAITVTFVIPVFGLLGCAVPRRTRVDRDDRGLRDRARRHRARDRRDQTDSGLRPRGGEAA
jgi:drug/metabolite transporter (DMT)-like permease